jgi:hypothetical protein
VSITNEQCLQKKFWQISSDFDHSQIGICAHSSTFANAKIDETSLRRLNVFPPEYDRRSIILTFENENTSTEPGSFNRMMTIYCDACGIELVGLRPQSRYCPKCGISLQTWVIEAMQRNEPPAPERSRVQRTEDSQSNPPLSPDPQEPFVGQDDEEDLYGVPPNSNARNATSPLAIHSPSRSASVESVSGSETRDGYSEYQESEVASTDGESESGLPMTDLSTELSLNIRDHNLPPPFPVPARYNQAFPRRIINKILGGSPQTTYPVTKDRHRPMYACPKMSQNPTLPSFAGAHGVLISKPVPKELVLFPVF